MPENCGICGNRSPLTGREFSFNDFKVAKKKIISTSKKHLLNICDDCLNTKSGIYSIEAEDLNA